MGKKKRPQLFSEFKVTLQRVAKGKSAVPLDYPENLGMRTKLGGEPDWIQDDDTPECASCGEPMVFVAQIDSIENENEHNPVDLDCLGHKEPDYMFGDVGMIYVFFCFNCCQSACLD